METNVLSELSLQMLNADSKDPIRRDVINVVKLGMDLQRLQKIVNKGRTQGIWLKYIDEYFGKHNTAICCRALGLYRHRIPFDVLMKTTSATELYSDCTMGYYKEYKNDPRKFWMKTLQMKNENQVMVGSQPKPKKKVQKNIQEKASDIYDGNRPNKDIVEDYVVSMGRQYFTNSKVNCLTVTGERYQKHIDRLFAAFADKAYVIEKNPKTMKAIEKAAAFCPYCFDKRVTLIPFDANEVSIINCPFIDLDIEGTFPNVTDTIQKQALAQKVTQMNSPKIFAFTFSSRGGRYGSSEINYQSLKSILSCFDVELTGFNGSIGNFGKKGNKSGGMRMPGSVTANGPEDKEIRNCFKHIVNCRPMGEITTVYDIVYFTYNDSFGPMGHMAIAYT